MLKFLPILLIIFTTGCAHAPMCPPQPVQTVSVCSGQQVVIRYRDFLGDVRGKQLCPPVYVVTGQLCGR